MLSSVNIKDEQAIEFVRDFFDDASRLMICIDERLKKAKWESVHADLTPAGIPQLS